MSEVTRIFTVLVLVLIMYFAWMDVALYYKLQSQPENLLLTQNYQEAKDKLVVNNATTTPPDAVSKKSVHGDHIFDPFNPISIKLLMLDHCNHYIYYPLGSWIDSDILNISDGLTFITPDMISLSHVAVAGVAYKFLSSESLTHRRLGVLLFEVRSFLDSLDGLVARARSNQRAMVADHTQWGYWMDGLCDLLGTTFLMFGVLNLCQRAVPRSVVNFKVRPSVYNWVPTIMRKSPATSESDQEPFLPTTTVTIPSMHGGGAIILRHSTVIVACLSLMLFLASDLWNRYMEQYHVLLEVPIATATAAGNAEKLQLETVRSASFWCVYSFFLKCFSFL
jgi:hypothetical protein